MEAVSIGKQKENNIGKFYLDSLEFFQIKGLDDKRDDFIDFNYYIRDKSYQYIKYRPLEKLGPILLYIFLKTRGILLVLPDFLDWYNLKYHEFTTDLKKVLNYYPDFNKRDKKTIIKKFIATVLESFNVDQPVISHALTLFSHFYPLVQHTKEEIVSAVICTLAAVSFDLNEISMRLICGRIGIPQSSLRLSIIRNLFPYLGIPASFGLKSSFELIKGKIAKKTSLLEINARPIEEEIENLWRSGHTLNKITEVIEIPKKQIIAVLKREMGDYRNYKVRYRITQREIDTACHLRREGFSFREIAPRIHRQVKIAGKIVEANLENHAEYKYIPRLNRLKIKELASKELLLAQIRSKCEQKEKLRNCRRKKYAENKIERELRLNEVTNKNIKRVGERTKGRILNAKEVETKLRTMKPKSYPALLDVLTGLGIFYELNREIVHSRATGDTPYASCSFSLEDVKYKVVDNSSCMWTTSKGAKGNYMFNLVRQMFDKE